MLKIVLVLPAFFAVSLAYGQTDSLTREERLALDSMFKNDEFIKMMMAKEKSYFDVNIGIGNGIFSLKNNALNAGLSVTNKIFYTPTIGYYHKSGFAITATAHVTDDEGSLKMYRYAISPSYVYTDKNIDVGVSYTRFIDGSSTSFEISPFKNDLYGGIVFKKTWIEPGIALGYSSGRELEYFDTSFWVLNTIVHIRDTITTKLNAFSLIVSATHKWDLFELLSKKDALRLQPILFLNCGSLNWNTTHSNRLNNRLPRVQDYLKNRFGNGSGNSSFKVQSLAFLGEITYYYGKFYLQPEIYLDYYLPSTTEKRLTTLFSVVAGFTF